MIYADNVNLIGDDTGTIERNVDVLLNVYKGICLVENTGETKYKGVRYHRGIVANGYVTVDSN